MSQDDERGCRPDGCTHLSGATPGECFAGHSAARPPVRDSARPVAPHETGWDIPPRIMPVRAFIARNLAASFLAGAWSSDQLLERGRSALLHRSRSLGPLI